MHRSQCWPLKLENEIMLDRTVMSSQYDVKDSRKNVQIRINCWDLSQSVWRLRNANLHGLEMISIKLAETGSSTVGRWTLMELSGGDVNGNCGKSTESFGLSRQDARS